MLLHARLFGTLEWMLDDWATFDERAWGPQFLRGSQAALKRWRAATVGA